MTRKKFIDILKENRLHDGGFCFFCEAVEIIICSPITYILLLETVAVISIFLLAERAVILTSLMWAFACITFGAFVGFLFAIPKRPQNLYDDKQSQQLNEKNKTDISSEKTTLFPNTNLQDVSDWLTKIIIGISLVEFNTISGHILSLSTKIGQSAQGSGSNDYSMYAMALIVFFVISGFLVGYLATRLRISPDLREADNATIGKEINNRFQALEDRVRAHEDISDLVSVARDNLLRARIFLKIAEIRDTDTQKEEFYKKAKKLIDLSIIGLKRVLGYDEGNIPAAICIAKCYAISKNKNYTESISALTKAIIYIENHVTNHKIAIHRLFYNRACYTYLLSHDFSQAKADLIFAVQAEPFYKEYAMVDPDWEDMVNDDEFIKIMHLPTKVQLGD